MALDACQLLLAREYGIIHCLPQVSEEELQDQSKGDFLVKGLAMAQSIYLGLQLIVRHLRHQPSSQLEVVVVAFAVCSFITFFLLMSKPQDVQTPRFIKSKRYPTADEMLAIARCAPRRLFHYANIETRSYAIRNFSFHIDNKSSAASSWAFTAGSIGASIMFGSFHCIAWNFVFPTNVENFLWRLSSRLTILIPFGFTIL
jgi:hypothetical protein